MSKYSIDFKRDLLKNLIQKADRRIDANVLEDILQIVEEENKQQLIIDSQKKLLSQYEKENKELKDLVEWLKCCENCSEPCRKFSLKEGRYKCQNTRLSMWEKIED